MLQYFFGNELNSQIIKKIRKSSNQKNIALYILFTEKFEVEQKRKKEVIPEIKQAYTSKLNSVCKKKKQIIVLMITDVNNK